MVTDAEGALSPGVLSFLIQNYDRYADTCALCKLKTRSFLEREGLGNFF